MRMRPSEKYDNISIRLSLVYSMILLIAFNDENSITGIVHILEMFASTHRRNVTDMSGKKVLSEKIMNVKPTCSKSVPDTAWSITENRNALKVENSAQYQYSDLGARPSKVA